MRRLLSTFLFLALFVTVSIAQGQSWTLEQCVRHALENNLEVQLAELNIRNDQLTLQQSQLNRLPNVNGSISAGWQFGRTIDPTTNEFNNSRIGFNSYGVNAGVTVFNGGRINNQVRQAQLDLRARRLDAESTQQRIALNTATGFLNILLAEEQLANTELQLELSQQQLTRTNRLIEVGQLPANSRLDLEAQVARNEQLRIEAQNLVESNFLILKQLLQLDPNSQLQIERPEVVIDQGVMVETFDIEEVYQAALQTQADVQAADLRVSSAQAGEKVSRADYFPRLSIFGNLNTNYSSVNPDFSQPNTDNASLVESSPRPVTINGDPATVTFLNLEGVTYPTVGYGDQLNENFGQSLGVSISVPIYNNNFTRTNVERSRLNTISAEVQSRQARDLLKSNVQLAVTNFHASRNSFQASERAMEAAQAAFNDAERRFEVGAINSFELNDAVDNLDIARTDLTRARYQLLFNLKVVEFYLGRPLEL